MMGLVEKRIKLGTFLIFLVLLVNSILSYQAARRVVRDEEWVRHTYQVITQLEAILSTIKDAESGERGYIITGSEADLQPYHAALSNIEGQVRSLEELTADNPQQQERIPILRNNIDGRIELLKTGVAL